MEQDREYEEEKSTRGKEYTSGQSIVRHNETVKEFIARNWNGNHQEAGLSGMEEDQREERRLFIGKIGRSVFWKKKDQLFRRRVWKKSYSLPLNYKGLFQ